jgi:hypothetical protein
LTSSDIILFFIFFALLLLLLLWHVSCGYHAFHPQVKQFFVGKDHVGDVPLHLKIASGLATGAIAITVASPTDLVKVRPCGL